MAAPGTVTDPNNPFKAIGGQTFAGGSSNAAYAIQNPYASSMALRKSKMRAQAGMGAPVSQNELYSDTASPSFGFGTGDPRYGGGGNTQRDRRIGNLPGTMSAPSPTSPFAGDSGTGGGLGAFYGANARDEGGNRITNPYTGLPYNSSANDRLQQQAALQSSGDQQGLAALGGYNAAVASGNPNYVAGAQQNINAIRAQRGYRAGYGSQGAGAGGQSPDMGGGTTYNASTGQWERDVTPRAKGGPVHKVNPYIVGEKGPEEYVPKHGKPEMIGMQGEEMRTFPQKGKIIPNDKLHMNNPLLQKAKHREVGGAVVPSNIPGVSVAVHFPQKAYGAYPSFPTVQPVPGMTHRAGGGMVSASNPYIAPMRHAATGTANVVPTSWWQRPLFGPRAPINRVIGAPGRLAQQASALVQSPFVEPAFTAPRAASPADLLLPENYGPSAAPELPNQPSADEFTNTSPPSPHGEPEWDYVPPATQIANPFTVAPSPTPMGPSLMATPLQQNMYDRGATNLSPTATGPQTFLTKYGTVSNAPTTKHTIEGLAPEEWFQRAANRWGTNPYAAPEKGFPAEGQEQQIANRGVEQQRIAALNKKPTKV